MLSKGVITEQNRIFGQIGKHGVWPVEHGGFDEYQLLRTEAQFVARFYDLKIPVLMIKPLERFGTISSAVDGDFRNILHQLRQSPL